MGCHQAAQTPATLAGDGNERLLMSRITSLLPLLGLIALPLATPAAAQDDVEKGIYGVARVGGTFETKGKLDENFGTFQDETKYNAGLTGELGAGYDFGMFRVEQTLGYSDLKINRDKVEVNGFTADGRTKMFKVDVAGYIDIPIHPTIVPYIGGGVGAARVESRLSRVDQFTGVASRYDGKDWGLLLHADAGVGIKVAPKVTVEVGGRYTWVNQLKFEGQSNGVNTVFEPKMSTISGTVGVRYAF
jgi:opacity protein-like surface antigen